MCSRQPPVRLSVLSGEHFGCTAELVVLQGDSLLNSLVLIFSVFLFAGE